MKDRLTTADLVWNRATDAVGDALARGDSALAALLRLHNLAMNGGVFHALELMDLDELRDAQDGFRFFGLDTVADLLSRATAIMGQGVELDEWESRLDREYLNLTDDSSLFECFDARFRLSPEDFSPL